MAAPTSYTESTLATFMLDCLKDVATALGWTALANVQEAVNETLLAYGVDSIASVAGRENIRKLRALARVEVWRLVVAAVSGDYDFKAGQESFSRSQVHEQALKSLAQAQADAAEFAPTYAVGVGSITWDNDPYNVDTDTTT